MMFQAERLMDGDELFLSAFRDLVELCDAKRFTWSIEPSDSRIDREHRRIVVRGNADPALPEVSSAAIALVCFGHEVGHLHDPPTTADIKLVLGSPAYFARALERENTAWTWAEDWMRNRPELWSRLSGDFAVVRDHRIAAHRRLAGERVKDM